MAEICSIDRDASAEEAMKILDRDGAVIYRNVVDGDVIDRVSEELEPFLKRAFDGEGEFWGYKTKRVASLIAKSPTYGTALATCPQILGVMDKLLLPHCERYQLHVTQAVRIRPGEGRQIVHRDDALMPFRHPGPQSLCNTMWSLNTAGSLTSACNANATNKPKNNPVCFINYPFFELRHKIHHQGETVMHVPRVAAP